MTDLKQQPSLIERLYGKLQLTLIQIHVHPPPPLPTHTALITDLYMDHASFKGLNAKNKVPELLELLDNCDLDSLLRFFHSK